MTETQSHPGPDLVILAELLRRASEVMARDPKTAGACIARASEVLKAADPDDDRVITPPSLKRGSLAPWQAARLKAHIDANLNSNILLTDMAALVHLSPAHLSRTFKRSFGEAPHAFVTARRIERAQLLMLSTDEALSQIALALGFADQSHFSRLFRQIVGTSPNAWRRERRKIWLSP